MCKIEFAADETGDSQEFRFEPKYPKPLKLELLHSLPDKPKIDIPILFVHGAWHGAWCWEKYFMPFFRENGVETYALSFRGHGNSPSPKKLNTLTIKDYVEDIKQVVDQMGRTPIMVGHSMGGRVVQEYMEKYPVIAGILLASVPPLGVLRTTFNLIFTRSYALPVILTLNLYGLVNSKKKATWAFFSPTLGDEVLTEYSQKLGGESFRAFLGLLKIRKKTKIKGKLPVLVLAAEKDNIFTPKEARQNAQKYGVEAVIFPDMAHDMMLEPEHEQVAKTILDWISGEVIKRGSTSPQEGKP